MMGLKYMKAGPFVDILLWNTYGKTGLGGADA